MPSAEGGDVKRLELGGSPEEELLFSLANHLISLAAIVYGSHYTLRRWIAISKLRPPVPLSLSTDGTPEPEPQASQDVEAETSAPGAQRGWRRYINLKSLKSVFMALAFVALELFLIFGVGRIASVLFLDLLWSVVEVWLITGVTKTAIMVLWPFPQTVKYVQSKKSKAVLLDHETETGRPSYINMLAASFACASLVLGSSLVGSRMLHPLVVGLWVLNVMSPIEHYRMRVKYVVYLINGFLLCVGLLTSVAMGGFKLYEHHFGELSRSNSLTGNTTSPWLARLMLIMMSALPSLVPGILIAMTLRYDYSKAQAQTPPLSATMQLSEKNESEAGGSVLVPQIAPSFPKPTFISAMIGLILSLLALDIGTYLFPQTFGTDHTSDCLWTGVSVPVVTLFTLYATWSAGDLDRWWNYEERWWWTGGRACQEDLEVVSRRGAESEITEKQGLLEIVADEASPPTNRLLSET